MTAINAETPRRSTWPWSRARTRKDDNRPLPMRRQIFLQAICVFVAMSVLFPLLWVLGLSLDPTNPLRPSGIIPSGATLDNFVDAPIRGIDLHRVMRCYQWGGSPGRVARIALREVTEKGGEGSTDSFVDQLLIPAPGALFDARGQEHLEGCVGEHDGAHVPPFSDKSGRFPERSLSCEQRLAHGGKPCHLGGAVAARLLAHRIRNVLPGQEYFRSAEFGGETLREFGDANLVVGSDSLLKARERHQAIQRAAFKAVKTQRLCDPLRDGSLARSRRAVDCDHRYEGCLHGRHIGVVGYYQAISRR